MDYQNVYGVDQSTQWAYWPLLLLCAVLGAIGWLIIAVGIVLEKADVMDRSERIAQLYGYTVCLIAIVVIIVGVNAFVGSAFEYANPLAAGTWFGYRGQDLNSFEAYKATYTVTLPGEKTPAKLSDSALQQQYDALRNERIQNVRFDAVKSMTTSAILILIALVLFVSHWRWLRARARSLPAQ